MQDKDIKELKGIMVALKGHASRTLDKFAARCEEIKGKDAYDPDDSIVIKTLRKEYEDHAQSTILN